MKLILCPHCQDVVRLKRGTSRCMCGKSWGRYVNDIDAEVNSEAIPLGFDNASLVKAIKNRPMTGRGYQFTAFVIPFHCPTVTKKDDSGV